MPFQIGHACQSDRNLYKFMFFSAFSIHNFLVNIWYLVIDESKDIFLLFLVFLIVQQQNIVLYLVQASIVASFFHFSKMTARVVGEWRSATFPPCLELLTITEGPANDFGGIVKSGGHLGEKRLLHLLTNQLLFSQVYTLGRVE